MKIVDSHCHLHFAPIFNELDDVINRAAKSNVNHFLTVSTALKDRQKITEIIDNYPQIYGTIGVHPLNYIADFEFIEQEITECVQHKKIVAVGEIGLDQFHKNIPLSKQIELFRYQIHLANEAGLPIVVHTRDAQDVTVEILKNINLPRGVIHSFVGNKNFAKQVLDLGLYISFSPLISCCHEVLNFVPRDRFLIETDSPFLLLGEAKKHSKFNEPALITYVLNYISKITGLDINHLSAQTTQNFFDLFHKVK